MELFAVEPLTFIYVTTAIIIFITILSLLFKDKLTHKEKILFFAIIAVPVLFTTVYLAAHTINHNLTSVTKGPVHWHLDYQVWVCGERLDLIDPKGLRNKIGTPLLHEHNDDRIHVEGTVGEYEEVTLKNYFKVIGGHLSDTKLSYPVNEGIVEVANGMDCNGQPGVLNIYINGKRVENAPDYLMYPDPNVPPGDCVIIEFSPEKSKTTNKICESWQAKGWNYENYEELRGRKWP